LDIAKGNTSIPYEWMISNFHLSLFLKKEKRNEDMPLSNYCFVPKERDLQNGSLLTYLLEGRETIIDTNNGTNLLISPAGDFTSIDEFSFHGLSFIEHNIYLLIEYLKVEDQDGDPFKVVPVFIIPINNTMAGCKRLIASFKTKRKDFMSGLISDDPDGKVPSISIDFSEAGNLSKSNYGI
jgi:hypothetical protein